MNNARRCVGFLVAAVLIASPVFCQEWEVSGRVYRVDGGAGIPSLTINLRPPQGKGEWEAVTGTDAEGRFKLPPVPAGRYLLAIYQGPTLVYHEVIDVHGHVKKEIAL